MQVGIRFSPAGLSVFPHVNNFVHLGVFLNVINMMEFYPSRTGCELKLNIRIIPVKHKPPCHRSTTTEIVEKQTPDTVRSSCQLCRPDLSTQINSDEAFP